MISDKFKVLCIGIFLFIAVNFGNFAQLKNSSNRADYIIITPSQFVNTLQPFVNWRQSKNINIKVAELDQIYSEFPDSSNRASLRDFISYVLSYWSDPKPRYVLLTGNSEFIPSYKVPSIFVNTSYHEDSVSVDEWYSVNKYQSDTRPDAELGRFPVNNDRELNNIINKTIYFEDSLSFKDYNTDFLFLTDIKDSSAFQWQVHRFMSSVVPLSYSVDTVFAGRDSSIETTREKFLNILNNRTLFLSYYGHGAPYKWSVFNLFTVGDVDSLNTNNLPFIFASAACEQSFDYPNDSSIARKLLVIGRGGIAASVNSNGLNILSSGSAFLTNFYEYLFNNSDITIGEAMLRTKLDMETNDYSADAIPRRYTLLGDPALKIPLGTITRAGAPSQNIPDNYSLEQNFPNPFNPSTTIRFSVSKTVIVTIKVYNILGQVISTLVNEEKEPGNYEINFNGSNISGGIYFCRMKAGNFEEVKKLVLLK